MTDLIANIERIERTIQPGGGSPLLGDALALYQGVRERDEEIKRLRAENVRLRGVVLELREEAEDVALEGKERGEKP